MSFESDRRKESLPDWIDGTIPNERKTWEELMKIKAKPIPMAQKRALKARLSLLPILKLKGWQLFKWRNIKALKAFSREWTHRWRNIVLLQKSLRSIEIKCGTSIANVFLFIKWTLSLNMVMFIVIILFIMIPYQILYRFTDHEKYDNAVCPHPNGPFKNSEEQLTCCTKKYNDDLKTPHRESISNYITNAFNKHNHSIENNIFFYGYYEPETEHESYNFALAYATVTASIFFVCLAMMVRNIARGIKEMVLAREGDHYKYSNLIFGGWDHFTKTQACALFKRKVILHEIKIALQTETTKKQDLYRSKKENIKNHIFHATGHIVVFAVWCLVGYLIYLATEGSIAVKRKARKDGNKAAFIFYSFSPQLVIITCGLVFPIILGWLGKLENYDIQTKTTLVLIRSMFVRLLGIGLPAYMFYKNQYCHVVPLTCTLCTDDKAQVTRLPCWETLVSELIYKLIITDLVMKIIITFIMEPAQALIGKKVSSPVAKWATDLKFNITRHSLDMIYIQALSWIGFYFSPVLPGVVALYCYIVFYIKKFSVMNNCNSVPDTFRTTRTTTIYIFTKLFSFAVATITMVFVMGYMKASNGCGAFRQHPTPWNAVILSLKKRETLYTIIKTIISPGVATPVTIILILGIYYYYSVAQANKEMVETLKHLLVLEGHDKQYLFERLNALRRKSHINPDEIPNAEANTPQ